MYNTIKMKKLSLFLLFLITMTGGVFRGFSQVPTQCQDVMLQAFYWDSYSDSKWTVLNSKADEIAPLFSMVWLPPSGNCQSTFSMGYSPIWWFDQNSAFGSASELKTLNASLKTRGAKPIADVVINHRNGATNWTDFPTEVYNGVTYSMGPAQICSTDEVANQPGQATPTGAPDTGEDFDGSRDLDHLSAIVNSNVKGYMQFLKNEMGYSGWRYDMVKGYYPTFVFDYNTSAQGYFSVGEYFDGSYDLVKAWINGTSNTSAAFDFPQKFALNNAMWNGGMNLNQLVWMMNGTTPQPAGLIHHPDTKKYGVTFVDNHDTYVTGNPNRFSGNVLAANAFLMGSPGVPCILLAHWNANKTAIFNMIAARRAVKLHNQSDVIVNLHAGDLYVSTATGLNGTLILKLGSGSYTPPSGYTLVASGTDYAIWTKVTNPVAPLLMVSLSGGTFFTSQNITATASSGASIYYTTNNTTPNNTSTLYSGPIPINTTTTLRIIAYDPATQLYSREVNNTYIINSMPSTIKIRFKAPTGWTGCKAYCWEGSTPLCGAWPGSAMTLENDGYYTYSVTGFANLPIGVVFNNGAATGMQQTVDLFTSEDKCWDAGPMSGGKYTAIEVPCPTVGVGEPNDLRIRVWPNPTKDVVYFVSGKAIERITVHTVYGTTLPVVMEKYSEGGMMNLSGYPSGVYYFEIVDIKGNRTVRPVVKH